MERDEVSYRRYGKESEQSTPITTKELFERQGIVVHCQQFSRSPANNSG